MGSCRAPLKSSACALAAAMLLAAPTAGYAASPDDPLEPFNRSMYTVHRTLDHWFFRPAAMAYAKVIPQPLRKGLRNLINNLKEPGIAFNDLLQAHPTRAGKTTARFLINSTVGLGGLMDIAYNAGLPFHENGFGDTAGRWGMTPGPYLFIPFIGPKNFRDALGDLADIATDPLAWRPFRNGQVIYARAIVDGLDERAQADAQLKAIDDMSADPYASLRSLYEQNRAVQIQEAITGMPGGGTPSFDDLQDPGAAPAAPAPTAPTAPAPAQPPGAPQTLPSAEIERHVVEMLDRPLRVVSGATLEPARAG
jgi:phospholipid-binding lipoprotein MlaA